MSGWQEWSPFGLDRSEKESLLSQGLISLTKHHYSNCPEYRRMIDANGFRLDNLRTIEEIPFLPSRLFKLLELLSIDRDSVTRVLMSSSTTGQAPSKVFLDKKTSLSQTTALMRILQNFMGSERMPMLIIDHPGVLGGNDGLCPWGWDTRSFYFWTGPHLCLARRGPIGR